MLGVQYIRQECSASENNLNQNNFEVFFYNRMLAALLSLQINDNACTAESLKGKA